MSAVDSVLEQKLTLEGLAKASLAVEEVVSGPAAVAESPEFAQVVLVAEAIAAEVAVAVAAIAAVDAAVLPVVE